MSTNRKATMAKRQRELAQKDRVKDREARREERKARAAARAASGLVGPDMGEPEPSLTDGGDEGGEGEGGEGEGDEGAGTGPAETHPDVSQAAGVR